ncbi:MAG: phosphomethylpyrimidine kinase [Vulcanisaeta sp.]|nr:phosphomethylpyrimidine kinase [Vulcanisaeta sp.]
MSINTGFEFVAEHVLPIIRSLVAKRLMEKGFSQLRIARVLGITQPAVNRYVSKDTNELVSKAEALGIDKEWLVKIVDNVVNLVINGKEYEALEYLTSTIITELGSLRLCEAHRRAVQYLPVNCNVCSILLTGVTDSVLRNLEKALAILETHPEIQVLMPRVLMNIVEAKPGAITERDVAGLPGRIDVHDGKVLIGSRPIYGGSKHLGKLMIKCIGINPRYRSVMNIKYDETIEQALKKLGMRYVKVGPHEKPSEDEVIDSVANALSADPSLDAVIDLGGYALEPITYVFGFDAIDVVLKVINIARTVLSS